jgi:hypothetical protein
LTLAQARLLLKAVLPTAAFEPEAAIQLISYLQRQNHAAYLAHRRTTCKRLDGL